MDAYGVQVGVGAVLPQADPDVDARRRHRHCVAVATEGQQEARVLPVRGGVPAAPGTAPGHPAALEVTVVPLAVGQRGRRGASGAFHGAVWRTQAFWYWY